MTAIENDPSTSDVLRAARRVLGRLERDPYDRALRTRQFTTPKYGQVRSTPLGVGEWSIGWQPGPAPDEITIIYLADASP